MDHGEIYERFLEWMQQSWYGVPNPEEALSFIKSRYSPEDAGFLTGFPYKPSTIEALSKIMNNDTIRLEPRLELLARKGLLYRTVKEGIPYYALNDIFYADQDLRMAGEQG